MKIVFSDIFQKKFKKLPQEIKEKFEVRTEMFLEDQRNSLLNVHPLKGNLVGMRAFSITANYRVIFKFIGADVVKLVDIGKHSQVYK